MDIKILLNYDTNLWCTECKTQIRVGKKFGVIYDMDSYGQFEKTYHLDCLPIDEENDLI